MNVVTIEHNVDDINMCYKWAWGMLQELRGEKLRNDVKGFGNTIRALIAGKLGELAFAKHFGFTANFDNKSDGGVDFIMEDGRTVDVKSTPIPNAKYLIWPATKPLKLAADILVGAIVRDITFDTAQTDLHGYIERPDYEQFFERSSGFNGLVKNTQFMYLRDLKHIDVLKG